MSASNKGRIVSEETRKKFSLALSGENHYFFGKHHTAKTRARIGSAQRGYSPYKNLLNEIDARQFSYTSLAKLMGIAGMTVSGKMRCKQNFNADEIKKLEEIFGKPAEYLLKRDNAETEEQAQ